MPVVLKPAAALHRKRLAGALFAVSLCMLTACSNDDDKASDPRAAGSTNGTGQDNTFAQVLSATPPSASPPSPALTIQTPALPASSADTAQSSASPPLATPVIHTVD
ncbi:hypothetical protein [Paraburkholderia fungorum]|uniref:hypothetical protein n=1 Tax=Paraburkholderia fungorum TaxID=134537 RepID=UPI0038B80910